MSELKDLSEILVIKDELPSDFFTNDFYDKQLDAAIESTTNLVYPLDGDGEKLAKADATSINKFAKMFDGFIAKTFKSKTSDITLWRDNKKDKTKILYENRKKLLDQFIERRQEVLDKIAIDLDAQLIKERNHAEIDSAFYSNVDFSSLIKLTGTLTPKGSLTKKATDFIRAIANNEKSEQIRIEGRHLHLENRCLRAEINPPLTHIHLGTDFHAEDDVFNAKVEELVNAEIERKSEMEARIIKQQEAKKQAEIDAALKAQQAEADAIAKSKAQQERLDQEKKAEDQLREHKGTGGVANSQDTARHMGIDSEQSYRDATPIPESTPEPVEKPVNGKHEVVINAVFRLQVSDRVSDAAVIAHFIKQLPEKLELSMISAETK